MKAIVGITLVAVGLFALDIAVTTIQITPLKVWHVVQIIGLLIAFGFFTLTGYLTILFNPNKEN